MLTINLGLSAVATGTADAITATYSPAITLSDRKIVFLTNCVPNTVTNPTFNPNGLGAKAIKSKGAIALKVGEIKGDCILIYHLTGDYWELLASQLTRSTLEQILLNGQSTGGNAINGPDGSAILLLNNTKASTQWDDGSDFSEVKVDANGVELTGTAITKNGDEVETTSGAQTKATAAENNAKAYADGLVIGLWDDRGNYDASVNAYPSSGGSGTAGAILKGDIWTVLVSGTLPTGQVVEVGDVVRALIDTPGNTQANWAIQQNNIGYVAENSANKTGTIAGNESSTALYPHVKGVVDWIKEGLTGLLSSLSLTKVTPVDADSVVINDSVDSNKTKLTTWANVKATLKTYFDTLYVDLSDGRLTDARHYKLLGKNLTPATGTSTTSEELLQSFFIPASTIVTDDYLELYSLVQWNNNANTKIFKIYFSPTALLSDVNKIQVATGTATTNTGSAITRRLVVKSNTLIRSNVPGANSFFFIDAASAGSNVPTDITVPSMSAGFYVLISAQKAVSSSDTTIVEHSYLTLKR